MLMLINIFKLVINSHGITDKESKTYVYNIYTIHTLFS